MEKCIDMTVIGIKLKDIKNILLEAGLKKRLFKGDFSDGNVSVTIGKPYALSKSLNLGISSENPDRAAQVYSLILEKKEEMAKNGKDFYIKSNQYMDKISSGTGTGTGGFP